MPKPEPKRTPAATASPAEFEVVPPHRTTPALLLSLALHVILLTSIGLILSRTPRGSGSQLDRPIGIAMVHRLPDREQFVDAAEIAPTQPIESESVSQASAAAAAAAPPADFSPPIDLNGLLQAIEATPAPQSGSGLAGETQIDGSGFGTDRGSSPSTDAGQTTTTVFGVSGSGSRFVYVFDRSDSMNGYQGKPLRAAKAELLRSLQSLTERQRFQIVFYNDKPTPFRLPDVPMQMIAGEESLRLRAQRYVNSIAAFGGTEHADALKLALRMSPDVIFFLTDARIPRLSATELHEIQVRAQRSGTTIHAIEFGHEPVAPHDSFLRDLATMNQGQYQYVDVRQLGRAASIPSGDSTEAAP